MIAWRFYAGLRGAIRELGRATHRLAQGDLTARVRLRSRDELEALGEAFNRMAEALARRTRELERAHAAKTRFLATLSHELRTPLQAILGYGRLLQRGLGGLLTPRGERFAVGLLAAAQHLLALVENALQFVKLEAGEERLQPTAFRLAELVEEAQREVEALAREKGVPLVVRLRRGSDRALYADRLKLERVLVNLLTNAVRAARGRVELRAGLHKGWAIFAVHDDGPGVPEGLRDRDRLVRALSGPGGLGTRAGLGHRAALRRHARGPDPLAEPSRPGQPVRRCRPDEPARCPSRGRGPMSMNATGPTRPKATVLVVEDDPRTREVVGAFLAAQGYDVVEAQDGVEALERVRGHAVDVVLLDLMLPKLDGWAVLAALRRTSAVPVVVITARDRVEERVRGLRMGADDYVVKPFDLEELEARLEAVLRRVRPQRRLRVGELTVDELRKEVRLQGRTLALSPKEYELLVLLARHPGRVFSPEELAARLWPDRPMTANDVAQLVYRLRRKLEPDPAKPRFVVTVLGFGYRLRAG